MDGGQRVDRITDRCELTQYLTRIAMLEQRPGAIAAANTFREHVDIRVEPDRYALFKYQRACIRLHECSTAGSDHLGLAVHQPGDHPAFAVTEMRFAKALENLRDAQAGGILYLMVRVDEGEMQPRGKAFAYR